MVDLATAKLLLNVEVRVTKTHSDMKELKQDMARVREVLEQLQADVAEIKVDVPRVLAKVQQLLDDMASGNVDLAPDMQARVDEMRNDLSGLNAAMDAAVPAASVPPNEDTGNQPPAPPVQ